MAAHLRNHPVGAMAAHRLEIDVPHQVTQTTATALPVADEGPIRHQCPPGIATDEAPTAGDDGGNAGCGPGAFDRVGPHEGIRHRHLRRGAEGLCQHQGFIAHGRRNGLGCQWSGGQTRAVGPATLKPIGERFGMAGAGHQHGLQARVVGQRLHQRLGPEVFESMALHRQLTPGATAIYQVKQRRIIGTTCRPANIAPVAFRRHLLGIGNGRHPADRHVGRPAG